MSVRRVSVASRLDSVEASIARIESAIAALAQGSSAATTTVVAEPKARKAQPKAAPKAAAKSAKPTYLRQSTRKAFIAAALKEFGEDYTGFSTKEIALSVVAGLGSVPTGFAVGEGYRALVSE